MQAPRLVATDVDGTLLDPHDQVTHRTAAVIGRAVAAGVGFVLVTGRPPRWIPPVVEAVGVGRYAVCANGAVLYDALEDRVVWSQTLDPDALAALARTVGEVLPTGGLAVERVGTGARGTAPFVAEPAYRHAWPDSDNHVTERSALLSAPAVKMLVRCAELSSEAMVAALAPVVGDTADLTFSHPRGLVEMSPPRVTKATGLAEVAGRLGVDVGDVVAFGDMPNDLEMLRWAGHGVAMGNAHPILHDVADEITASNADDGLALVLERWF
ncbi:Cof-type HAD-IIB family hydrolase [Pseudonocardia petroleophila]|uniref:HAD family hydrolase n=1 Tax=Pseudonocardia petroleophila TaxID=37331 RepID=A0A7G7MLZ3_9PSEU|nr:HAD family hydrolase [Pseudonocardia petroleophila]QNG53804.1 HAD family hydrolase [Pseudonocardia petroleophila]